MAWDGIKRFASAPWQSGMLKTNQNSYTFDSNLHTSDEGKHRISCQKQRNIVHRVVLAVVRPQRAAVGVRGGGQHVIF